MTDDETRLLTAKAMIEGAIMGWDDCCRVLEGRDPALAAWLRERNVHRKHDAVAIAAEGDR